jgi:regulation of enolase protein 1 (concanavalin A-like superfamily)
VWTDYAINNTGMTVGHLDPPYAETTPTNVRSGNQSMYMRYDNDGKVNEGTALETAGTYYYSQADRQWSDPQDWTKDDANSLAIWFKGLIAEGTFTLGAPIIMTGAGTDIGGTSDEFHFAYKQLSGNGSITAKVLSLTNTNTWAQAGVMMRETLDAGSKHVTMVVTPGQGTSFRRRLNPNASGVRDQTTGITAPYWVKLTRSGNIFKAERSADGKTWVAAQGSPVAIIMLTDVYVGLVVTSRDIIATCTAEFSDVDISGTVTDDWQSQDIGTQSNAPAQLYVVLQDSAGNSAVVRHPEPASSAIPTWTQWQIPLADFTGVNPQAVNKLSIGVGDRDNPQFGGAGSLYIDDIRLYLP